MKRKWVHSGESRVCVFGRRFFTRKRNKFTRTAGFTFVEMLVAVLVAMGLMMLFLDSIPWRNRQRRQRITCVNNLKQIGTAYRIWANDNGDVFPAQAMLSQGGWRDYILSGTGGLHCFTNYAIMQNELGQSARVVVCPQDERVATTNFDWPNFNNHTVSYFVGPEITDQIPQGILGGDRNLALGNPNTGGSLSPEDGRGSDTMVAGAVFWTRKMHSSVNGNQTAGAGNILLGDGSAQQVTSREMTKTWLPAAMAAAQARAHRPVAGQRLIFP